MGHGLTLGIILGGVAYTGGNVFGATAPDSDRDPAAEKEVLRRRFRRPLQETVNEIGEGRGAALIASKTTPTNVRPGIYPPGYEERRRQRIKERYGIDIQEPYYNRKAAGNAP